MSLPGATSHLVRVLVQHSGEPSVATGRSRRNPAQGPEQRKPTEPDMPGMPDMAVKVGVSQMLDWPLKREDFTLQFVMLRSRLAREV